jgi:hypothetical protein
MLREVADVDVEHYQASWNLCKLFSNSSNLSGCRRRYVMNKAPCCDYEALPGISIAVQAVLE